MGNADYRKPALPVWKHEGNIIQTDTWDENGTVLGSGTICPLSSTLHPYHWGHLASDHLGASDLLFAFFPPELGGLQDGGSVPRSPSSAFSEASEQKFLLRLCVDDFLPLFKGDTVLYAFDLMSCIVKRA